MPVRINKREAPQTELLVGAAKTFEWNGAEIGLFEARPHATLPSLVCYHGTSSPFHVHLDNPRLHARVDASGCTHLKLRRPGYDLIHEDPNVAKLRDAIKAMAQQTELTKTNRSWYTCRGNQKTGRNRRSKTPRNKTLNTHDGNSHQQSRHQGAAN